MAAFRWPLAGRAYVDACPVGEHERVDADIKGVNASFKSIEGGRDIVGAPDRQHGELKPERRGRCPHLAQFHHGIGKVCIGHDGPTAETGNKLAHESEPLAYGIGPLRRETRDVAAGSRLACNKAAADRVVRKRKDDRDVRRHPPCREGA